MHRSTRKPTFVVLLSLSLLLVGVAPTRAATPQAPAGPAGGSSGQLTTQQWATLKADLNAGSLPRTVTVSGGVRTFTYTLPTGSALVLREPVGQQPEASSELGLGWCGFLQLCVYLNRADQGALAAGGAVALGALICVLGTPAVCVVAGVALAVAASYIGSYGFCPNLLQVGLLPVPGSNIRCV